ncbi:hypothetical protein ACJMK2_037725, partial [Sinanodonta woodiana]
MPTNNTKRNQKIVVQLPNIGCGSRQEPSGRGSRQEPSGRWNENYDVLDAMFLTPISDAFANDGPHTM